MWVSPVYKQASDEADPLLFDYSLTGLLSFMLSEEMTTGSITSTDAHKRAFAARSHTWNLTQPKFKEAFPDVRQSFSFPSFMSLLLHNTLTCCLSWQYCSTHLRDLPNMGGNKPVISVPPQTDTSTPDSPSPAQPVSVRPNPVPSSTSTSGNSAAGGSGSWATVWQKVVWERWRWGLLIAVAVLVSRFSSIG